MTFWNANIYGDRCGSIFILCKAIIIIIVLISMSNYIALKKLSYLVNQTNNQSFSLLTKRQQ